MLGVWCSRMWCSTSSLRARWFTDVYRLSNGLAAFAAAHAADSAHAGCVLLASPSASRAHRCSRLQVGPLLLDLHQATKPCYSVTLLNPEASCQPGHSRCSVRCCETPDRVGWVAMAWPSCFPTICQSQVPMSQCSYFSGQPSSETGRRCSSPRLRPGLSLAQLCLGHFCESGFSVHEPTHWPSEP